MEKGLMSWFDKLWEEKAQHFIHGYLGQPGPTATPGQSCLTIDVAALWIPYVRKGLAKLATECLLRGKAKVCSLRCVSFSRLHACGHLHLP